MEALDPQAGIPRTRRARNDAAKTARTKPPEQRPTLEQTRAAWRASRDARARQIAELRAAGSHRLAHDLARLEEELSEVERDRYVRDGTVPAELAQAVELLELARHHVDVLTRAFLDEGPGRIDAREDPARVRVFVARMHRLATSNGPGSPPRFHVVSDPDPRGTFAALTNAEQRSWRITLMRFVDAYASAGAQIPTYAEERAGLPRTTDLPFALASFKRDDLAKLLEVWPERRGGAKRSGSRLTGKWRMLARVLHDTWGCSISPKTLEDEWGANRRR